MLTASVVVLFCGELEGCISMSCSGTPKPGDDGNKAEDLNKDSANDEKKDGALVMVYHSRRHLEIRCLLGMLFE